MSTLTDLSLRSELTHVMSCPDHCDLREVFETPGSRQVADLLVSEGLKVAEAEGVTIPQAEADHILQKVRVIIDKFSEQNIPGDRITPREQDLNVCGCPEEKAV